MTTAVEWHPVFECRIPDSWRVVTVDQIKAPEKSSCVAGPFGSNISSRFFVDEGVPVIRGGNLREDLTQFVPEGFVFVSADQAKKYPAQHVHSGDLIFTCWGTIGQVGRIPENGPFSEYIISNKQLKLRSDPTLADSLFLYYYFASPAMVAYIRGRAIGSAVPGINLGILKGFPVALPPLPTQRKIAAILSAYDDLIENNNRRVRILEEMAQRIYREWFVDFRYPGHENVPLVDSELGRIPESWPVVELSDLTSTQYGYTESATDEPVGPRFLRGKDINKTSYVDWANVPYCPIDARNQAKYRLARGDVVIIRMADPGKVGIVEADVDAVFASYLIRIQPRADAIAPYFLFYFLSSDRYQAFVSGASTGTTRKSLSAPLITSVHLALPPPVTQVTFVAVVAPLRELLNALVAENATLRATRGLLLSRLISGDVDVSELNIASPEIAA